ncbi:MAG: hydrogen gas-evolving membrane-bound hydrogenase subunit E [Actinomycetota bacterium]
MLFSALLLHGLLALLAPLVARRMGPRVFLLCAAAPLATVVWAATVAEPVLRGEHVVEDLSWVEGLGIHLQVRLDGFSLLMVALVSGVGVLIFAYSRWYFSPGPALGKFAGTLTAFAGSMLGLILADNLLVLYVFWELTSVTSYLLIGFEDRRAAARSAALQALLVTGAGGLAMLGGFVLIGQSAGTYSLSGILADPPSGGTVEAGLALVLLGAFTKSAQVPFHFWLPAAMAAPTPVSAYLHSATMVKGGVYLVARLAPAFAVAVAFWRPAVLAVGMVTMVVGGLRALKEHDLKLLLAYGTVSQLGFMVVLVGSGHPALTFAGAAVILAHGLFKATLFMVAGIVDHQAHTRDIRVLTGLARSMPTTFAVATVATASMAGLPLLFGFVAKEAAFESLLHESDAIVVAGIVVGSALTFAYGARFLWGAFGSKPPQAEAGVGGVDAPSLPFLAPAAVLAALTLALGLAPRAAETLVQGAAGALDAGAGRGSLALWHGFTAALGLSALAAGAGAGLFLARSRVEHWQARARMPWSSLGAYEYLLRGLNSLAGTVTGIVQNGSLPVYITVILLTAVALPGGALAGGSSTPVPLQAAESSLQVVVGGGILATASCMALARNRIVAVLLLGAVGYGVAVLFIIQGAPDLALTQLLIETLALVIFMLVLRHLPPQFERTRWPLGNALRVVVATTVGLFVAGFALLSSPDTAPSLVSEAYIQRSLPEGGGRNVVNVILTDFRALDTLGEITVLTVAALGIASLVLVGRPKEPRAGGGGDAA